MAKQIIVYLGSGGEPKIDHAAIEKHLSCKMKYLSLEDSYEELFDSLIELSPKVALVEISSVDNSFLNFLLLLKSHRKTFDTRLVAIFPDKNNLNQYSDIYSFGIEYGLVAGEEKDRVLSDIGIFYDSSQFEPLSYACAEHLRVQADITFLAKLSHLTEEEAFIETSFELGYGEVITAKSNISDKLNLSHLKVVARNSFLPRSYFKDTARMKILFKGDQDLQSLLQFNTLDKKEYLNFFRTLDKDLYYRNDPVLIVDRRVDTLGSLIEELNTNNRFIKVASIFRQFEDQFHKFLPQVICYEMEKETSDMADDDCERINGPTTFNYLIQKINSIANYNPYVLVFNDRSRSTAYRKAYGYNGILVNKKTFELDYVSMIVDEYQNNKPVDQKTKYFIPPDRRTLFSIEKNITLTSISENKVTFLFAGDLNHFATFKIPDPLNLYVTVIPTVMPLESPAGFEHYTGLISNTSEEDKMELRKLVNLLIEAELSEESPLILKSVSDLKADMVENKSLEMKIERERQKEEYEEKKNKGEVAEEEED